MALAELPVQGEEEPWRARGIMERVKRYYESHSSGLRSLVLCSRVGPSSLSLLLPPLSCEWLM